MSSVWVRACVAATTDPFADVADTDELTLDEDEYEEEVMVLDEDEAAVGGAVRHNVDGGADAVAIGDDAALRAHGLQSSRGEAREHHLGQAVDVVLRLPRRRASVDQPRELGVDALASHLPALGPAPVPSGARIGALGHRRQLAVRPQLCLEALGEAAQLGARRRLEPLPHFQRQRRTA